MHQNSFVLIPCPNKVESGLFKLLGAYELTYPNGNTEDLYVVAFKCDERSEIPSLVFYCFEQHLHMHPTDENVVHAAILATCGNLLMICPDGTYPTEERAADMRQKFNISTNRYNMMFLGARDGNMEQVQASMKIIMSANQ
jgi:hypothetical protein